MNRRIRDRLMTAEDAAKWIQPQMWVVSAGFRNPQLDSEVFQAVAHGRSGGGSHLDLTNRLDLHWQSGWKCPDIAVLNASILFSEGFVPTASVANSALLAQAAKKIILEWNVNWPSSLIGLHDIYEDACLDKVVRVPMNSLLERLGTTYVPIDWSKVIAVVKLAHPLRFPAAPTPTRESAQIANHLLNLLENESLQGRLPGHLPPLQTSPGAESRAFFQALAKSHWSRLSLFTDVLDDSALQLIRNGQIFEASASTLDLQDTDGHHLHATLRDLEERLLLRPHGVVLAADLLPQLGLVAINTASQIDLFGNVKLHQNEWQTLDTTQDFARHARLSVIVLPSRTRDSLYSQVVQQVNQVDLTAREVDVVVSEHGVADLRGLSVYQRANQILHCCADPAYHYELRRALTTLAREPGQLDAVSRVVLDETSSDSIFVP